MRKVVTLVFVVTVLPLVMAAQLTMTVEPNPNGTANTIRGKGTWDVGAGETFSSIVFYVTLENSDPPQVTSQTATIPAGTKTWTRDLLVAPANYKPTKAVLFYQDQKLKMQELPNTDNAKTYTVK